MSFGRGGRRGGGGGGSFPINNNNVSNNNDGLVEVTFKNWNQASRDDLVGFVMRKTGVQLKNVHTTGAILHGYVSPNQVRTIEKYNGVKFAGQSLSIWVRNGQQQQPQQSNNGGAPSAVERLKQCLAQRYNEQNKMLNLSNMKDDPILNQMGTFTAAKMFGALMKLAGDTYPKVESVDLSNNMLQDIGPITTLSQSIPDVKNLSLANNQISRTQTFEPWRHKFPHLRELILSGNPIANQPGYKDEIMKMFSKLIMLDGVVIRDAAQIAIPRLPNAMKQSFFENPDVENVANGFLNSYFQLYDTDRSQLLQLYDDLSILSISVDNGSPRVLNGPAPTWTTYIPMSRNLIKVTNNNPRQNRMYIGTQVIADKFKKLPQTKHDFGPGKFAIDVWCTNSVRQQGDTGVAIALHGEHVEPQSNNALRSFDRTFVILQNASGQMIVASDMITFRPYSDCTAWQENVEQYEQQGQQSQSQPQSQTSAPAPASAPGPPGAPAAPAAPTPELEGLNPEQIMIVQNLMQATNLNAQYARMCAEGAQFNPQQAMALFEQNRAQLPPNAFQQ